MSVNIISVLVATALYMLFGTVWFSRFFFGKVWVKEVGERKIRKKYDISKGILNLARAFVMAYALAFLVDFFAVETFERAIIMSLAIWIGFPATFYFGYIEYFKKSWKIYLIPVLLLLIVIPSMAVLIVWINGI